MLEAYAVFLGSYLVFAIGKFSGMKVDRLSAAIIGAVLMVAFRVVSSQNVLHFIDFGTILLLFSMRHIVGCRRLAGSWEWITDLVLVRLKPRHLLPAVMLLKSLVPGFATPHMGWLILAMASTLAGNLTITGSAANIIVVERARPEVYISFRDYFRVGLPVTLLTLGFGLLWLWWIV